MPVLAFTELLDKLSIINALKLSDFWERGKRKENLRFPCSSSNKLIYKPWLLWSLKMKRPKLNLLQKPGKKKIDETLTREVETIYK